jgi:Zn-dependent protease with chaperone function
LRRRAAKPPSPRGNVPGATISDVHEEEIGVARWRIRVVAAAGVALLSLTVAVLVFPIALVVFAAFGLLGASWGFGVALVVWSAAVSAGMGVAFGAGVFAWSLARAERRALEMVRAWPHPGSPPAPPPRMAPGACERAQRVVQGLAIAAGVLPPSCAVVIDDAPNCLTVGRNPKTAWIVVTTGLLELPRAELEAVLAYEIGRVAERDVSLDTVVYACSARGLELWAAAFGEFDEMTLLLAPFAVLLTPVVGGGMLLRAAALRTRARLSDGLAIRYCRNPVALAHALHRILDDPAEVRRGDPGNAHLWLEYPHTRASRWFLRTHRILPRRVQRLERLARLG